MTGLRVRNSTACLGAMCAVAGCGWDHLDAIGFAANADAGQVPDAPREAMSAAEAGAVEASADNEVADVSVVEAGMSLDSMTTDVAGPSDASSTDSASFTLACTGSPAVVRQWTFDVDTQAWTLSMNQGVQGGLAWNGSMGDPAPGALEVTITPGSADAGAAKLAWARYQTGSLGDLSGRTLSAWVWSDRGASPQLKLFVLTGNQYVWADNGTVTLNPGTWTCLSMPISSPAYNGPGYDPTSVVAVGIEARNSVPFRLLIDTVRYY